MSDTTKARPQQRHKDDGDCPCACNGPTCRVVCGVLLRASMILVGFALYSSFYGAQDANDYYNNCVQIVHKKQGSASCVNSNNADCVFAPGRTCAMSTVGFIIGSVFFWVFYVILLPVIGPFALWDWIVGLL